ncbi:MAG: hypothetical protein LUE27_02090 [Clostridia bacterium]|nr:hypothetical protein [Clostridia bacterium]
MTKRRIAVCVFAVAVALCLGVSFTACTVENVVHEHAWGDWETTCEATCTSDGLKTRTCTECGETETETIPATGHDYQETEVPATCTTSGYTASICSKCNALESTGVSIIEATGHSWDEGTVTTEATCTEAGVMTYTCEACGATKEETTDALGHSWDSGEITTAATCTTDGVKTYTCTRNGCNETKTETIAATGHNYEITSTTATCTEDGEVTYRCTNSGCDATDTVIVPKLGHSWDSGEITTAATCTTDGVKTYTCTRDGCGETYTETIDKLGHDWAEDEEDTTVSCTEAGKIVYKCSRCDETYEVESEALGHDWTETITKEPTCTTRGIVHYECSRCGLSTNDASGSDNLSPRIDALGHKYVETYTEATCSEAGYTTYVCSRCGDTYTEEDESNPALGHQWVAGSSTTVDGITTTEYTCSWCGGTYTEKTGIDGYKVSEWDGTTVDTTSWLEKDSDENPTYEISNAAQFAGLAEYVNEGNDLSGCTVKLTVNIDLGEDSEWTPIGTDLLRSSSETPFSGTFEGQGHTVYNVNVSTESDEGGLFGYILQSTIKDVNVYNVSITEVHYAGAIVGEADDGSTSNNIYSTISGCNVSGDIKISGSEAAGGIIGEANKTVIESCSVEATADGGYINSSGEMGLAGGIAGSIATDATSSGTVTASQSHIYDVSVSGLTISSSYYVGGFVGLILDSYISASYSISSADATKEGSGNSISNCTILLTAITDSYAGAIFGVSYYGVSVEHVTISSVTVKYYGTSNINAATGDTAGYYGYCLLDALGVSGSVTISSCNGSVTLTQISN